eukprot:Rhum_TRINITY_DN23688_c0_g1::Rhum_TRINITY_DN23688_c0_g1_i1::g.178548::m.178548/K01110/PTEN; phosphatidylinositol-3,4,5-trisphosphate 3-phosphatase and dual-specificity protein phosphatase PTEN
MSCCCAPVRRKVSQNRKRYQSGKHDLDLTYLSLIEAVDAASEAAAQPGLPRFARTQRLLAMGYPATGIESFYRNPYKEVKALLEEKHAGHFKVYNLCVEKQHQYAAGCDFDGRYAGFRILDHNPAPLRLLAEACVDIHSHLSPDSANVAVVHCKAGKGRTGTVCCCYKLHSMAACLLALSASSASPHYSDSSSDRPPRSPLFAAADASGGSSAGDVFSPAVFGVLAVEPRSEQGFGEGESAEAMQVLQTPTPLRAAEARRSIDAATDEQAVHGADGVIAEYGAERTKNGKGVTIPSQARFVRYYSRLMAATLKRQTAADGAAAPLSPLPTLLMPPFSNSLTLKNVTVQGFRHGAVDVTVHPESEGGSGEARRFESGGGVFDVGLRLTGEFRVGLVPRGSPTSSYLCQAWFHAGCESHARTLALARSDLDISHSVKQSDVPDGVAVSLFFSGDASTDA